MSGYIACGKMVPRILAHEPRPCSNLSVTAAMVRTPIAAGRCGSRIYPRARCYVIIALRNSDRSARSASEEISVLDTVRRPPLEAAMARRSPGMGGARQSCIDPAADPHMTQPPTRDDPDTQLVNANARLAELALANSRLREELRTSETMRRHAEHANRCK